MTQESVQFDGALTCISVGVWRRRDSSTCHCVLQVSKVRRSADGEVQLLRGTVRVRGLQVFVGDEDAVTTSTQIHHSAGAPPCGQTGGCPVHLIHLNTAAHHSLQVCVCFVTLLLWGHSSGLHRGRIRIRVRLGLGVCYGPG